MGPSAFTAGADASVAEFLLAGAADLELLEVIVLAAVRAWFNVSFVRVGEFILGAVQRAGGLLGFKVGWMHGK